VNRGPAAEWLREQTLDRLGARTVLVDGEQLGPTALAAPQTRIDPADDVKLEHPTGAALTTSYERPLDGIPADGPVDTPPNAVAVADVRDPMASATDAQLVPPAGVPAPGEARGLFSRIPPAGLALISLGLLLMVGGGLAGWRRGQLHAVTIPALTSWTALIRRLPRRR